MANLENFGPDGQHLYFRNKGLFSDNYLAHRLEKEKVGYVSRFWNSWGSADFNKAYEAISDLWNEKKDYLKDCKESQLEDEFIKHVFNILGWEYVVQPDITRLGKRSIPDYALFSDKDEKSRAAKIKDVAFFERATAVADAKAMKVDLDGIAEDNTNPSYQIISYLDSTGKKWGILTNGRYWRIYSNKAKSRQRAFYEVNLETILDGSKNQRERFKYFFNFFRKDAFVGEGAAGQSFLDIVFSEGETYASEIETELKERAFTVVEEIAQGFCLEVGPETDEDLKDVYDNSLFFLFRLMFILNCEAKAILPVSKTSDYYRHSLRKICNEIKEDKELNKKWSSQTSTYDQIVSLLNMLKKGDSEIKIHGFGEEFFQVNKKKFFTDHKIPDSVMNQVLLTLACEFDKKEKAYRFIDFERLSVDHLGSIFEGLLEYKLVGKRSKVELVNTSGERKSSGSYYTPDYMVDFIVEQTISPMMEDMIAKDVLKFRVLDPAMGSGHFLLGVVRFLEARVLQLMNEGDKSVKMPPPEIRREVLKNCVFGVDKNSLAKELAKFSLWMASADEFHELEPLDDQLEAANSLADYDLWKKKWKLLDNGVDAVVGNPPYLGEKGHKEVFQEIAKGWLGKRFYQGKMDLFYFFFHLGLDVLKEEGRLGFITTNYYPTALGAKKLREDLYDRSRIDMLMNLNELKVFGEAAGQHNLITIISKSHTKEKSLVVTSAVTGKCDREILVNLLSGNGNSSTVKRVVASELFDGDERYIRLASGAMAGAKDSKAIEQVLSKMEKSDFLLGDVTEINTGIQTGADKVSPKHLEKFKIKASKDDGVFVLSEQEVERLKLPKEEKKEIIKPFFKNSDIDQFSCEKKTDEFLIYLDKRLYKFEKLSSQLRGHIDRYEKIISASVCSPPYLHRPRRNEIFLGEKIVVPQRSKLNTFGYNNSAWYASCDVYFITQSETAKFDLKYLLGVLNSKLYYLWLYARGKRKGEALELYQKPLSEVPLKDADIKTQQQVIKVVDALVRNPKDGASLQKLNQLIYQAYDLSEKEIQAVEQFYSDRTRSSGKEEAA